uniref:Uncharacterized protein n=1 Tax=Globodera pallida TaxID=36090 RepID=A0A183BIT6_GLOPA
MSQAVPKEVTFIREPEKNLSCPELIRQYEEVKLAKSSSKKGKKVALKSVQAIVVAELEEQKLSNANKFAKLEQLNMLCRKLSSDGEVSERTATEHR